MSYLPNIKETKENEIELDENDMMKRRDEDEKRREEKKTYETRRGMRNKTEENETEPDGKKKEI